MPSISSIEDTRPKFSIEQSRNVTFGTKLYNADALYNKDQRYFAGVSAGIFPQISTVEEIKSRIIKITGGGETYYVIIPKGMSMGLLLTLTYPQEVKRII